LKVPTDAPQIQPVAPDSGRRPRWSVMIPTYNARADYLEQTLLSILQQAPGAEEMQIEVVDDCSPKGAPVEVVERIGQGRIAIRREPVNRGLARIWNRCIELARGEWVHILHQDDIVQPGFYAALRQGTDEPTVGAAFSRFTYIDPRGNWLEISSLLRDSPGILEGWQEEITVSQHIQCASIVVRRAAYERLGGFLPQFCYALDWEMWQRIAAHYAFWFEPAVLAGYRVHPGSATSRLRLEALDALDNRQVIAFTMAYHPPERAAQLARRARRNFALYALGAARELLLLNQPKGAWKQVAAALGMSLSWPVVPKAFLTVLLYLKLLASRRAMP
jgi:glycosyltransferase involved in cell wall biosynthesis